MTSEIWYYENGGSQLGPKSWESLLIGLRLGKLTEETKVWAPHLSEWTPIGLCMFPDGPKGVSKSPDSTGERSCESQEEGWYLNSAGREVGPTTWAQIYEAHQGQLIDENTYVWAAHLPEWVIIDVYIAGLNKQPSTPTINSISIDSSKNHLIAPPTSIFESNQSASAPVDRKLNIKFNKPPISIQSASDVITNNLGLEKIKGFSLKTFFSEAFRKHESDEVERLLSVGSIDTTPPLHPSMAILPNPWIFFRVLCGTLATYMVFLVAWKIYHNLNLLPGLIVVGSFALPFSVLILFFEINTPRNISLVRVVQLVIVGGSISILFSLFLFEITPVLGDLGAPSAGIIEEVGKLIAMLIAMRAVSSERYKYSLNGLLIGASLGAGFAAFESAGYALRAGIRNENIMLDVIQTRGLMSPFAHIAWTAITGAAFWRCRHLHESVIDVLLDFRFLRLFVIPVVLHTIWNMPFEGPMMVKFVILGFIAWVVILSLVQSGLNEVRSSFKH